GEVAGDYYYEEGGILPHRRKVEWYPTQIDRDDMTEALKRSALSSNTVIALENYADEIEQLIGGKKLTKIYSDDDEIEDPTVFALEKHLEDFLVKNWKYTSLGKEYDIYQDEGESIGQQYPTDTGPVDILAISKDKKELLVVELKKGRASDSVVGQIQRYMGYVKEELLEPGQSVKGVIIALEDDNKIRRALSIATNIEFYKYEVRFNLFKD
ncbi:MAG: DUF1016 family protein, partial [Bacteroidetes bacterium]|nr:DUF1016 family protein [Bacteroidota bacterium]